MDDEIQFPEEENQFDDALGLVIDAINAKRRQELMRVYNAEAEIAKYAKEARLQGTFEKGSKDKVWRKIASLPQEVDLFFTRMYGKDYFKDKDFFTKHFREWSVIDPSKI